MNKLQKSVLLAVLSLTFLTGGCSHLPSGRNPNTENDGDIHNGKPFQVTAWNFDWDDNIMYLPTRIVVKNIYSGETKFVSTENFAIAKTEFSKTGVPDSQSKPEKDLVQHYTANEKDGAFQFFRDSDQNYFLSDIKKALDKSDMGWKQLWRGPNGDWKKESFESSEWEWRGPSWNDFNSALSDVGSIPYITIISARGHSPGAILEGLNYLKDQKLIPAVLLQENIYGVTHSSITEKYGKGGPNNTPLSPSGIKAEVMKAELDEIERVQLPTKGQTVYKPDGTCCEVMHLWGFSDDDYENFEKARDVLSKELKAGRWPHVKLTLFYTGRVKPGVHKHAIVLKQDGTYRDLKDDELSEVTKVISSRATAN